MEVTERTIPYYNQALIKIAERFKVYYPKEIPYTMNYVIVLQNHNSFVNIVENINIISKSIYQGAQKYTVKSYKILFEQACLCIAKSTNIKEDTIAEMVLAEANSIYLARMAEFEFIESQKQAWIEKQKLKKIKEVQRKENIEAFIKGVDHKMSELVKELRITVSKGFLPTVVIVGIGGLGYGAWSVARYWHAENSAQAEIGAVRSNNQILQAENKELEKYKSVKEEMEQLRQQINYVSKEKKIIKQKLDSTTSNNKKLTVDLTNTKKELSKVENELIRSQNRIKKLCNMARNQIFNDICF